MRRRRDGSVDLVEYRENALVEDFETVARAVALPAVLLSARRVDREIHFVVYHPVQHVGEHAARRRAGYVR